MLSFVCVLFWLLRGAGRVLRPFYQGLELKHYDYDAVHVRDFPCRRNDANLFIPIAHGIAGV